MFDWPGNPNRPIRLATNIQRKNGPQRAGRFSVFKSPAGADAYSS